MKKMKINRKSTLSSWITMNNILKISISKRVLCVVILQTLVLFTMIGVRQWTLNTGTLITLETAPVDPRSLFAGDYVRLGYKIAEIKIPSQNAKEIKHNQTVYVVLTPKGKFWTADSVQLTKPKVIPPKMVIKGRIDNIREGMLFIRYGIENYFIPEGQGKLLERAVEPNDITVQVAVDRFGNAAISGVFVKDVEIYKEKLF